MKLSRREFIGIGLGGVGGVVACACGGTLAAAYLILKGRGDDSVNIALPPATPTEELLPKPNIIPRDNWGALAPNHEAANESGFFSEDNPEGWRVYEGDIREIYKTVVVHHSVIDEGDDLSTLAEIQRLHRLDRQWADVAYHYFIGKEGAVYEGRAVHVRGVHVAGFNTGSLGVCLLGNFMEITPTESQLASLQTLTLWLTTQIEFTHLAGHRDFNSNTVCPGDNLEPLLPDLAASVGLEYGITGYEAPATPAASSACTCFV